MLKKSQLAGALLLAGTVFLAGGCGYKTEPVPPDSIVPKAIDDLRYSVSEKGVTLNWTFPKETIRGDDLTDINTFDVYRAVVAFDDYCPTCPIPFNEPVQVAGGLVDPESSRQGTYETALLRSGHKYFFKVHARTSWWAASADSNIVSFLWSTPAKAPEGVTVTSSGRGVAVSWQAVTNLMDGEQITHPVMYQVLRSRDNKEFTVMGLPISALSYTDSNITNGETYYYKIQPIVVIEVLARDEDTGNDMVTEEVTVATIDETALIAPANVTASYTSKGARVSWEQSHVTDANGYRIYRRSVSDDTPLLVGEVGVSQVVFEDTNVPEYMNVYYSVAVFDKMEIPRESVRSQEASITFEKVPGSMSKAVSVKPVDRIAPGSPTGVTAVKTAKGIKIFWEKSRDADVKGYRVYRRSGKDTTASVIGEVAAVYAIFEDINVNAGISYYYTVTAFDTAETVNESVKSREASIRH